MAVNRPGLNSSPGISLNGVLDTVIIIPTEKKREKRKGKKVWEPLHTAVGVSLGWKS